MTEAAAAAERPLVLALDIGTSSVRARLYEGHTLWLDAGPEATRQYTWSDDAGGMTIPAGELVQITCGVIDAAVARARAYRREIGVVAVAAFWHGLLGLSGSGDPLTPVFSWGDQRGLHEARALREQADHVAVHRRTGCFIHPSYPSVRLLWMKRRDPGLFRRVASWVSFPEYLEERLFGRRRCSYSMASGTGLLDIKRLDWDPEMLERVGLQPSHLSPLADAGSPLRGLRSEYARRWPELERAEWHPALGDGACANIGSGALGRDRWGLTIGTTAAIRAVWEADDIDVPPRLWTYRIDSRRWVAGRALSNGANGIDQLRRLLRLDGESWVAAAAAMEPDAHGLTVLPLLLPERAPGEAVERQSAVVGMDHATRPEELARAWMEAVAYRLAEAGRALESALGLPRRIQASGGGIEGLPFWAGILADVLDRPVSITDDREATSRGAALLAQERLGWIPDLAAVPVRETAVFASDPDRHARYAAAMRRQGVLEAALREWHVERT